MTILPKKVWFYTGKGWASKDPDTIDKMHRELYFEWAEWKLDEEEYHLIRKALPERNYEH